MYKIKINFSTFIASLKIRLCENIFSIIRDRHREIESDGHLDNQYE